MIIDKSLFDSIWNVDRLDASFYLCGAALVTVWVVMLLENFCANARGSSSIDIVNGELRVNGAPVRTQSGKRSNRVQSQNITCDGNSLVVNGTNMKLQNGE
jgi:hypothetical protein